MCSILNSLTSIPTTLIRQAVKNHHTGDLLGDIFAEAFEKGECKKIITFAEDDYEITVKINKGARKDV